MDKRSASSKILCLCALASTLVFSSSLSALTSQTVNFAGISFVGDYQSNQLAYPHSISISKELAPNGAPVIDQLLAEKVSSLSRDDLVFSMGLSDYRTESSLVMSLAVDWENVATEKIGDLYKIVVDVHGQIIFFDYRLMKIIASYPVGVQVVDALKEEPQEKHIQQIVRNLYFDESAEANLITMFAERLQKLKLAGSGDGLNLRVLEVSLGEKVSEVIPRSRLIERQALRSLVGQSFSKYISVNQGISILPFTKGQSIGGKMAMRFANGDVFNLEVPDADFGFVVEVRGFKKAKVGETKVEKAWVYGNYLRVALKQPDFEKVYADIPFRHATVKNIPTSQTVVDDWAVYQEGMLSFLNQLSDNFSDPDEKWLKKVTNDPSAFEEMGEISRIISRSR